MGDTEDQIKLPDHTLPSDYSDVHPKTYDPDFISQISSRMQVPDRISVAGFDGKETGFTNPEMPAATQFVGMTVPDRIVLAGDNQHLALRQELELDLSVGQHAGASESTSYVGLITPPRTLTLEERFPVVEETDDQKMMAAHGNGVNRSNVTGNGHIAGPTPYDPGVNLHDSVLLNEENEATLLRMQVAKLTRRVQVIEQDNQNRANRELVIYPIILGYFLWKILGWFTRDR